MRQCRFLIFLSFFLNIFNISVYAQRTVGMDYYPRDSNLYIDNIIYWYSIDTVTYKGIQLKEIENIYDNTRKSFRGKLHTHFVSMVPSIVKKHIVYVNNDSEHNCSNFYIRSEYASDNFLNLNKQVMVYIRTNGIPINNTTLQYMVIINDVNEPQPISSRILLNTKNQYQVVDVRYIETTGTIHAIIKQVSLSHHLRGIRRNRKS